MDRESSHPVIVIGRMTRSGGNPVVNGWRAMRRVAAQWPDQPQCRARERHREGESVYGREGNTEPTSGGRRGEDMTMTAHRREGISPRLTGGLVQTVLLRVGELERERWRVGGKLQRRLSLPASLYRMSQFKSLSTGKD
ncbi:uncharacterized protein BO96DRAFT_388746 [Aspergillus niger CBS 101883]|uniref:Uncharacterized protein n=2 Tax=Aspergillus niger TaxID=5061 RepID=A2QQQ3_ASPNC|nr:uncharacterized protein BO96DRAFT_388746 [Aspergillus niger CBS 101883]XP_059603963.1 hypothetical protein An08g03330 [Aspergillus niger]PYH59068.1 hypothetical protein BO96DRAFT_388746 [Aspergillus niger CBS 101883]CAK45369.1 hypothetical protein An08g03330 [Aspergillus niger]